MTEHERYDKKEWSKEKEWFISFLIVFALIVGAGFLCTGCKTMQINVTNKQDSAYIKN